MMIVSPWVLGFSDISLAKWCNVLLGLVLAIAGAWRVFGTVSVDTLPITEEPQKKKRKTKNNVEQK
jgi:hypothetical protein